MMVELKSVFDTAWRRCVRVLFPGGGGGGTLGISGWGCAAGSMETLDKIFNQLISFLKNDTLFYTQTLWFIYPILE